jgi:hypothetical protein
VIGPVQRDLRDRGFDGLEQDGAIGHGVSPGVLCGIGSCRRVTLKGGLEAMAQRRMMRPEKQGGHHGL